MKGFVLLMSLIVIPFSHAATLTTDNGVELLAIDGKKYDSGFFEKNSPELADGQYQVVVKYSNSFRNEREIESKPHIFDLTVAGDTEISVQHFNNQTQAESAIKRGLAWIITADKKTHEVTDSKALFGEGMFPYSDIEKVIANHNQGQGITLASSTVVLAESNLTLDSTNQQQLIALYNASTKDQQKAFRIWLIEKDMK